VFISTALILPVTVKSPVNVSVVLSRYVAAADALLAVMSAAKED